MLMRTDPFRDLDRLAQQVLGTPARPAYSAPMVVRAVFPKFTDALESASSH